MYVCMYVCIYIYTCIYIYIHTYLIILGRDGGDDDSEDAVGSDGDANAMPVLMMLWICFLIGIFQNHLQQVCSYSYF